MKAGRTGVHAQQCTCCTCTLAVLADSLLPLFNLALLLSESLARTTTTHFVNTLIQREEITRFLKEQRS